ASPAGRGGGKGPAQGTLPELSPLRCADAARMRGEPLHASAVRYSRFLLLEVPGPWGTSALEGRHLAAGTARRLAAAAAASDTHVLLIRRVGRPSAASGAGTGTGTSPMAWALADTSPGAECVQWGAWRDPAELLDLDLTAALPGAQSATGSQRLALVCTNGKRDQCCAVRGRPVATAIAAAGWDTWECSHLGGHRFAATIMLLPTGDMFGWLDPDSALGVMRRFDEGQLTLSHYRGRCGQPVPVQAALHAAAVRLGDFRRGAIRPSWARPLPAGRWEVGLIHQTGEGSETAYRVVLQGAALAPTFLSCGDGIPRIETHYETRSFSRVPQSFPTPVA
ncbi:MAG: sucrase ferredoxin, partial [Trebonia sp.]